MSEQEQAFVSVRVKPGHPTGEYRRSGFVFHVAEPETMSVEDVTPEMAADPWLIIKPTNAPGTVEEPADVEAIEDPRIGELEAENEGLKNNLRAAASFIDDQKAKLDAAASETKAANEGHESVAHQLNAANARIAELEEQAKVAPQGEWLCTVADCERAQPGNGYKTAKGCADHMLEKHGG